MSGEQGWTNHFPGCRLAECLGPLTTWRGLPGGPIMDRPSRSFWWPGPSEPPGLRLQPKYLLCCDAKKLNCTYCTGVTALFGLFFETNIRIFLDTTKNQNLMRPTSSNFDLCLVM